MDSECPCTYFTSKSSAWSTTTAFIRSRGIMDPATITWSLTNQKMIIDYAYISGCAIVIYDYILTLHLEINLIWFSQWSYSKVLFLLLRYTTVTCMVLVIFGQISLDIPMGTCKTALGPASLWLLVSLVSLADVIVALRTWAVWRMNKTIGVLLAILVAAGVAVRCPVMFLFLKSVKYAPPPYSGYRGCLIMKYARILWVNNALIMVPQLGFLILMGISAFRSYKNGKTSDLLKVVHIEGIMFCVYIICFTVLNLAFGLVMPLGMSRMLNPLQTFTYSVLTARIVLSIRDVGNIPELHTRSSTGFHI